MDSVSRALLADFSLELKEWQEDTAVTLLLERGNGTAAREIPLSRVRNGAYQYRCEPVTLEETVNVGDKIAVSFACRDPYGLQYEFPLYEWVAEETEGSPYTAEGYGAGGGNIPILSWE